MQDTNYQVIKNGDRSAAAPVVVQLQAQAGSFTSALALHETVVESRKIYKGLQITVLCLPWLSMISVSVGIAKL